jgi:Zn-finger nucleic acid-binding protein
MDHPYRVGGARRARLLRCLYCGASRAPGEVCSDCKTPPPSAQCVACGQQVRELSVECVCGAPCGAWDESSKPGAPCPRCDGTLRPVKVGHKEAYVDECPRCFGCFARTVSLAEILDRAASGEPVDLEGLAKGEPERAITKEALLEPVQCPRCRREMDRARFAQRASLVVDVCVMHGLWLDAGELASLSTFVRDRAAGVAHPSSIEQEDRDKWERIVRDRVEEERRVQEYMFDQAEAIRRRDRYR